MVLKTVYICRHGSRQDWVDPNDSISVTGMYHDPSLSAHGLTQADHLGKFLAQPPDGMPVPEMLFSSGFYRCLQTVRPLARHLGKPVHVELGVGEWFSKAKEGSGLHSRPIKTSYSPHFEGMLEHAYESTVYPSRRGEGLAELADRIQTFVETFIRRVESEYPEVSTIVIVAHAATVIALGRALLKDKDAPVRSGTTSTSCYRRENQEEPWEMVWNARTDYLPKGEERSWSFDEVVFDANGAVVEDYGDGKPFTAADELPLGVSSAYSHLA